MVKSGQQWKLDCMLGCVNMWFQLVPNPLKQPLLQLKCYRYKSTRQYRMPITVMWELRLLTLLLAMVVKGNLAHHLFNRVLMDEGG